MKLNFSDRMSLLGLFPNVTTYEKAVLVCSLLKKMRPDQFELNKFNVKEDPTSRQVRWDTKLDKEQTEIDISKEELVFIHELIDELDTKSQMSPDIGFLELLKRIGWGKAQNSDSKKR